MSKLNKTALSLAIVSSQIALQTLAAERIDVEQPVALNSNNLSMLAARGCSRSTQSTAS